MTEYIKKDSAVYEIEGWIDAYDDNSDAHVISRRGLMHAKRSIEKLHAEDVEPVRYGQWILCDKQDLNDVANDNYLYECSECKSLDLHSKSAIVPYCWHCGVRMKDKTQRRKDE